MATKKSTPAQKKIAVLTQEVARLKRQIEWGYLEKGKLQSEKSELRENLYTVCRNPNSHEAKDIVIKTLRSGNPSSICMASGSVSL